MSRPRGPWPVGEHVRRVAVIERVRQRALAPRCQVCLCVLTFVAAWLYIDICTYCAGVSRGVEMRGVRVGDGPAAMPRGGDVRSAQARWPAAGAWAKAEGDTTHCAPRSSAPLKPQWSGVTASCMIVVIATATSRPQFSRSAIDPIARHR